MRWFKEHKLISVMLILLAVLVLIFALSVKFQGSNSLISKLNKGAAEVSGFLTSVGDGVRDQVTGLFSHNEMKEEIEALKKENEDLKRQLASAKLQAGQLEQLQQLATLFNYDYKEQNFNVVTADITARDGADWANTITIDRGTEAGIEPGKAAVNGSGLIGKVTEAGEGWAKIVPIIDSDNSISFKLSRDSRQLGIVNGNSQGYISGYMLDEDSGVAEGDIILTSGMGSYPEGLEIGTVNSVVNNRNTLIKEITVEPYIDVNSLRKVSVIL